MPDPAVVPPPPVTPPLTGVKPLPPPTRATNLPPPFPTVNQRGMTQRCKEPPYLVHNDLQPLLYCMVFTHRVRVGWVSIGWLITEYDVPILQSPEDGVGLYRDHSDETVSYSQYPRLSGGRP